MQIVPFLTHYLLVYANFDFSSFSLISYIRMLLRLPPYSILFIYEAPSIYIRIPFYLPSYSLLFTYVFPSIYIREVYHRHTGGIELSS